MKYYGLLIVMGILGVLSACGTKKAEIVNLPIAYQWEAVNMTQSNAALCAGVYDNSVYYLENHTDKFVLRFTAFDGKELKRFEIKKGKGPAQALHSLGVRIVKDVVYFADLALNRITMFGLDGAFIDSIDYDASTGPIVTFDIVGDELYFHSLNQVYIGKLNLKTGKIVKTLPYSKEDEESFKKDKTEAKNGILLYNRVNNVLYFGNVSSPFRLDVYTSDLQKQTTYTTELPSEITPMIFDTKNVNLVGDMVITSIVAHKDHVYSTLIGGRYQIKSDAMVCDPFNGEIVAFNTKNGRHDFTYTNELFNNMQGFFTVLGVTDEYIVLHIGAFDKYAKKITKDEKSEFIQQIVVLKKGQ